MWVKLDDRFHRNKKTEYVGAVAADLYVAGLEYCNSHLTDGFIPGVEVPGLRHYQPLPRVPNWLVRLCRWLLQERLADVIGRLTTSIEGKRPMWQRTDREGVPGYLVNDFNRYQPKRKDVLSNRQKAAERRTQLSRAVVYQQKTPQPDAPLIAISSGGTRNSEEKESTETDQYSPNFRQVLGAYPARARVPGTYDPGTIPDLRTSNVVLLSDQQADPKEKHRASRGISPVEAVENSDGATTQEEPRAPDVSTVARDRAGGPAARASGHDVRGSGGGNQMPVNSARVYIPDDERGFDARDRAGGARSPPPHAGATRYDTARIPEPGSALAAHAEPPGRPIHVPEGPGPPGVDARPFLAAIRRQLGWRWRPRQNGRAD